MDYKTHIAELKKAHSEIKSAFLRQDKAGCYHSVDMLAACHFMEETTGIKVQWVDVSDPQGACMAKGLVTGK